MKLIDTFYLGLSNLRAHLGRSLLTIGAIGTLFYLIFAAQLWFQGLENQYLASAGHQTSGAVIISANPYLNSASYDQDDNYLGTLLSPEEISRDITAHGGTIIDATITNFGVVLPPELFSNIGSTPADATDILLTPFHALQLSEQSCPQYSNSVTSKTKFYQTTREQSIGRAFERDDIAYSIVGLTPSGFCTSTLSFQNLDRKNTSLFNSILRLFPTPESYSNLILNNSNNLPSPNEVSATTVVATFPDAQSAYEYLLNGHGEFAMVDLPGHEVTYGVSVLAGTSPETFFVFHIVHFALNIVCLVLALIATVIVIFTSIRLVDQDKANIELYHAFGASKGQVQLIYLAYFLELSLGAALIAFSLASLTTLLYSLCAQTNLSTIFMVGFSLPEAPTVILWGLNPEIIAFAALLILLAPLTILINRKRF